MKQLLIIGTLCITGLSACNTMAVDGFVDQAINAISKKSHLLKFNTG